MSGKAESRWITFRHWTASGWLATSAFFPLKQWSGVLDTLVELFSA
jgi:hypothetical protein